MRHLYWVRIRSRRLLVALLATLVYLLLLTVDAVRFFSGHATAAELVQFGFSTFVALLFFAVGAALPQTSQNFRVECFHRWPASDLSPSMRLYRRSRGCRWAERFGRSTPATPRKSRRR